MIHSPRFKAVLDACVLYPAPLRDFLLSIAEVGMFKPFWTEKIHEEWTESLLIKRPDLKRKSLDKAVMAMNTAFPDSNIENYESLINTVELPDPDDRHVMAAAVKESTDVIVTINIKDFPDKVASKYDIEIMHPDQFICHFIDLDKEKIKLAFSNQLSRLKNPPLEASDVFNILKKTGLSKSIERLKKY